MRLTGGFWEHPNTVLGAWSFACYLARQAQPSVMPVLTYLFRLLHRLVGLSHEHRYVIRRWKEKAVMFLLVSFVSRAQDSVDVRSTACESEFGRGLLDQSQWLILWRRWLYREGLSRGLHEQESRWWCRVQRHFGRRPLITPIGNQKLNMKGLARICELVWRPEAVA